MSAFFDKLDEYLGDSNAIEEIRAVVRPLYFYDFDGYPTRIWEGQGTLITHDDNRWLGTIDAEGNDLHIAPPVQDARDGSSANYTFGLTIPDLPNQTAGELYEELKADQSLARNRNLTIYLAIFENGEGVRPGTPYIYFKQLTMFSPKFSEAIEMDENQALIKRYKASILAKDTNFGRSITERRSYADTMQKQYAREFGETVDRGAEFLAALANRTYVIP